MKIEITTRNASVTKSMKNYAREKAQRLSRYFEGTHKLEVVLKVEGERNIVDLIVSATRGQTFVAQEQHEDMYAGIDLALDKMETQLRRFKEKIKSYRDRGADPEPAPASEEDQGEPLESYDDVVQRMDDY